MARVPFFKKLSAAKKLLTHHIGTPLETISRGARRLGPLDVIMDAADEERFGASLYRRAAQGMPVAPGLGRNLSWGNAAEDSRGWADFIGSLADARSGPVPEGHTRLWRGSMADALWGSAPTTYGSRIGDLHSGKYIWTSPDPNYARGYSVNGVLHAGNRYSTHPQAIQDRFRSIFPRPSSDPLNELGGMYYADVPNSLVEKWAGAGASSLEVPIPSDSIQMHSVFPTSGIRPAEPGSIRSTVYSNIAQQKEARASAMHALGDINASRSADSPLVQEALAKRGRKRKYARRQNRITPVLTSNPSSGRMGGVPSQRGRGGVLSSTW